MIGQYLRSRDAGFRAGWEGQTDPLVPPGVDALAYRSGVIEGRAACRERAGRSKVESLSACNGGAVLSR